MDQEQVADLIETLRLKLKELDAEGEFRNVQDATKEIADTATDLIRKYPLQSVLGATVLGVLIGSFLNRRRD